MGAMPAPPESSSSSSNEEVEVDEEAEAEAMAAAAKAAAKKVPAGMVDLSTESSDSEPEESSPESEPESLPEESPKLEKCDKTPAKVAEPPAGRGRGREPEKEPSRRGREPEKKTSEKGRGKSKSKGKEKGKAWEKGRRACPVCQQMVVDTKAGMEQHQYWSVPCNTWRRHAKGQSWEEAQAGAERQKERRTARYDAQHRSTASASKPAPPKKAEKKDKKKEEKKKGKAWQGHWLPQEEGEEGQEAQGVLFTGPTACEEDKAQQSLLGLRGGQRKHKWETVDQGVALGENLNLTAVRKPAAAGIYPSTEGLPAGKRLTAVGLRAEESLKSLRAFGFVQRGDRRGRGMGLTHLLFLSWNIHYVTTDNKLQEVL